MRRLKDHNNGVVQPSPTVDEIEDNAGYTVFDAGDDEDAGVLLSWMQWNGSGRVRCNCCERGHELFSAQRVENCVKYAL